MTPHAALFQSPDLSFSLHIRGFRSVIEAQTFGSASFQCYYTAEKGPLPQVKAISDLKNYPPRSALIKYSSALIFVVFELIWTHTA